jgi:hypothetical protein
LVSSPRTERKIFERGFDLDKADIVSIVEKLNAHVRRHYDVIGSSFQISIVYSDDFEIALENFEQFRATQLNRSETVKLVDISLSYLLGMNGLEGGKEYTKHEVQISFAAGKHGSIEIRIRSNDVSWPTAIFPIIEAEVSSISTKPLGLLEEGMSATQRLLSRFFKDTEPKDIRRVALLAVLLGQTMLVTAVASRLKDSPGRAFEVNEVNGEIALDPIVAKDLVEKLGVEAARERLEAGLIMWEAGIPVRSAPISETFMDYISDVPILVWSVVAVSLLSGYFVYRSFLLFYNQQSGRISVDRTLSPRQSLKLSDGLGVSIIIAVGCGLISTFIWEAIRSGLS